MLSWCRFRPSRWVVMGGCYLVALAPGASAQCPAVSFILQDEPVARPPHTSFKLYAHEVSAVRRAVPLGTTGSVTLHAAIVSDLDGGDGGIVGWYWGLGTLPDDDLRMSRWTEQGTALEQAPEGLFDAGFNRTMFLHPGYRCFSSGLGSAVVLSFRTAVSLPPRGTATVLSVTVEAVAAQGSEPQRGTVDWLVEGSWPGLPCQQGPGGGSLSPPDQSIVTIGSESFTVCDHRPASVAFVPAGLTMRRGDVNADARVDISDAIRTFMVLFLGAAAPPCLDAADTNDSGQVDISDGIAILDDFFLPGAGSGIPAPGPFDCGPDPTPDGLGCVSYPPCD